MWSGIVRQSLKKVVDGGGQGVDGSGEVVLAEGKFG